MRVALLAAALVTLSGCAQSPDAYSDARILDAFADSKVRVVNSTDDEHRFSQIVRVPVGANSLTVKAIYRTEGDASFVLKNPRGNGVRFDTFSHARQHTSDEWYTGRDPEPGNWYLTGHLTHGGAYAFGVYLT